MTPKEQEEYAEQKKWQAMHMQLGCFDCIHADQEWVGRGNCCADPGLGVRAGFTERGICKSLTLKKS